MIMYSATNVKAGGKIIINANAAACLHKYYTFKVRRDCMNVG